MRLSIILVLILTLLPAQPREALLIGNSNYQHISNLDNPLKNLKRLKRALEDLGFHVKIKTNLNSEELEESIDNFAKRLEKSSDAIGFLYYTGHGCQVDYQGYLVPTNVDTKIKRKIKYNALNINEMLETLKDAGNRVNMVFLDACRDVPTGAKGGTKGLGQPVERPKGSLIVYATEAGKVANDNSKFINSLIKNIRIPNQNIRTIGDNISNDVARKSAYRQIPEVYTKLLPNMVLNKRDDVVPVVPEVTTTQNNSIYIPELTLEPLIYREASFSKNIVKIGNLMYENQPFTKKYTWDEAKEYCSNLTLGGYSDWRLPTKVELMKLGNIQLYKGEEDYDNWQKWFNKNKNRRYKDAKNHYQFIQKEFLKNMPEQSIFWTSKEDASYAWSIAFDDGDGSWNLKINEWHVLCVH